jgi:hypothetical protein
MTDRRRPPNRRGAIAFQFGHANQRYRAHVGFFASGAPSELFLNAINKPDTTLDAFAADAAILVSLLLQHGASVAEIGHALRRTPNGAAASLVGAVVDELAALAAEGDR